MSDKPIIMAGTNVLALIDGRKSQTRRLQKPWITLKPPKLKYAIGDRLWVKERYLADPPMNHRAWDDHKLSAVEWDGTERRANDVPVALQNTQHVLYAADPKWAASNLLWANPLYMPRWASRITLTVTDIRIERLQDITEEDAIAEGLRWITYEELFPDGGDPQYHGTGGWESHQTYPDGSPHPYNIAPLREARKAYEYLWDTLHRKDAPWETNPLVAVYTFTTKLGNIDD